MAGQKIAIHLQNMINYFKFLLKYPGFWHNQIYKLSYLYNKNK